MHNELVPLLLIKNLVKDQESFNKIFLWNLKDAI
jgi:hypothetical protein